MRPNAPTQLDADWTCGARLRCGCQVAPARVRTRWVVAATGGVLVLFGAFFHRSRLARVVPGTVRPTPDAPRMPAWIPVLFSAFLLLVAAGVLFGLWKTL